MLSRHSQALLIAATFHGMTFSGINNITNMETMTIMGSFKSCGLIQVLSTIKVRDVMHTTPTCMLVKLYVSNILSDT